MTNKSTAKRKIYIITAACLFAVHTRDAKEIGDILNTTDRTIHRYAEIEDWEDTLQILNYQGERNFRVRPRHASSPTPARTKRRRSLLNLSAAEEKIYVITAACLFVVHTRYAKKIGNILSTSQEAIHRYAETEDWIEVLHSLNHTRPRRS